MSEPSKTGRLDVTFSGGIGSIDYGKIATSGGARRRRRSHRKHNTKNKKHTRRHRRYNKSQKRSRK